MLLPFDDSPLPITPPEDGSAFVCWSGLDAEQVAFQVSCAAFFQLDGETLVPVTIDEVDVPDPTAELPPDGEPGDFGTSLSADQDAYVPPKLHSDLGVFGYSYPPRQGAKQWTCSIELAGRRKELLINRPRIWKGGVIAKHPDQADIDRIPTSFEWAFGGMDPDTKGYDPETDKGEPGWFADNPVGLGYWTDKKRAEGKLLPCIEDPEAPVEAWNDRPAVQATWFRPSFWFPRAQHIDRMPEYPDDPPEGEDDGPQDFIGARVGLIKPMFYQHAHPDLIFPLLKGDEELDLRGFLPDAKGMRFALPGLERRSRMRIIGDYDVRRMQLDSVLVYPESAAVVLIHRSSHPISPSNSPRTRFRSSTSSSLDDS